MNLVIDKCIVKNHLWIYHVLAGCMWPKAIAYQNGTVILMYRFLTYFGRKHPNQFYSSWVSFSFLFFILVRYLSCLSPIFFQIDSISLNFLFNMTKIWVENLSVSDSHNKNEVIHFFGFISGFHFHLSRIFFSIFIAALDNWERQHFCKLRHY